jgi:hypothetical protein
MGASAKQAIEDFARIGKLSLLTVVPKKASRFMVEKREKKNNSVKNSK